MPLEKVSIRKEQNMDTRENQKGVQEEVICKSESMKINRSIESFTKQCTMSNIGFEGPTPNDKPGPANCFLPKFAANFN